MAVLTGYGIKVLPFGCARLVQLPDVFHDDAFKGTPAYGHGAKGERKLVWYAEDFAGNIVAAISDEIAKQLDYERVPYVPKERPATWAGAPVCIGCGGPRDTEESDECAYCADVVET